MTSDKFCQDCGWRRDCKRVYQQLGKAKGQSVALKAIVAFLLPIAVFIVSLALLQRLLAGVGIGRTWQAVLGLAGSVTITFVVALIISKKS